MNLDRQKKHATCSEIYNLHFCRFLLLQGCGCSQAASCWLFVLLLPEKSIVRVGNTSAGNSVTFDAWWVGKVV
jgi:hypothetical protein